MTDIEWEDPPEIKYVRRVKAAEKRAAMLANPGRWLVWSRSSTRANASNLRARYPEWEVEWAANASYDEDGRVTIFTRIPVTEGEPDE